jgi:predicted nucleotidyltransferase
MAEALEARARERERLIALARRYGEGLAARLQVLAVVVVGSVARGDFNLWSDVDVVVVATGLPARALDRATVLLSDAPPGVQPVGFLPGEFRDAVRRGNAMAREALSIGIKVVGDVERVVEASPGA